MEYVNKLTTDKQSGFKSSQGTDVYIYGEQCY